jgi:hypothetical protein
MQLLNVALAKALPSSFSQSVITGRMNADGKGAVPGSSGFTTVAV